MVSSSPNKTIKGGVKEIEVIVKEGHYSRGHQYTMEEDSECQKSSINRKIKLDNYDFKFILNVHKCIG